MDAGVNLRTLSDMQSLINSAQSWKRLMQRNLSFMQRQCGYLVTTMLKMSMCGPQAGAHSTQNRVGSCGDCQKLDELQCEGKAYESRSIFSCPLHMMAYQIESHANQPS